MADGDAYCSAAKGGEKRPSIGLVLGGGGARGLAHILMLEVFYRYMPSNAAI